MLTKEECKNALNEIYSLALPCREEVYEHRSNYLKQRYDLIKELIDEHFDNPPLKFEELKAGMWVWDDRDKEYIMVCRTCVYPKDNFLVRKGDELVFISKDDEEFHRMYRPNRFYKKEVKE